MGTAPGVPWVDGPGVYKVMRTSPRPCSVWRLPAVEGKVNTGMEGILQIGTRD